MTLAAIGTCIIAVACLPFASNQLVHLYTLDGVEFYGGLLGPFRGFHRIPIQSRNSFARGVTAITELGGSWLDGREHYERCVVVRSDGSVAVEGKVMVLDCRDQSGLHEINDAAIGWWLQSKSFDNDGGVVSRIEDGNGDCVVFDAIGEVVSVSRVEDFRLIGMWVKDRDGVLHVSGVIDQEIP